MSIACKGKEKRIPKKVVRSQELSLISENEHIALQKAKELSLNSENESQLMEKDKPSFVATIEQTRDTPAGSRNLFEVTLSDMGKESPREGQLLVTEANNAVREDGCIFVRSVLSTVKHGKVLIEILNLGRKDIKLGKGEKITRVFEVEYLPTRSMQESPMDVKTMHRKTVRKKGVDDRRRREVINATRETLMKKIHEDGKRKARKSGSKNAIPTKSLRLTPRQLRETYRVILTKTSREGSVLRNRNELERMIDFLTRNRDIVGLADDPIGKYPGILWPEFLFFSHVVFTPLRSSTCLILLIITSLRSCGTTLKLVPNTHTITGRLVAYTVAYTAPWDSLVLAPA
ncbi:hypothetical protein Avbf_14638 [Armadillidium vulgare]|nr:hypothetical protein Avbf_14638 [Armadillidium vulgare]